ncbi:GntR family transcriptional regulator [Aquabacter sp. CN5-332]|uniref:GntR family transcriptional regulator n=1 Tax=Aquabacter sp. CN5-332 TaxID=3156608 RepID=UPI0032B448DA
MPSLPSERLIPLYRQVSDQLRAAIMAGEFAPGAALPSESELCTRFSVSRITVRKALDELVERRLIVRRQGVGSFVREETEATWSMALTGVLDEALAPHRFVVSQESTSAPPPELAAIAALPAGMRMKMFAGTNLFPDGTPLMFLRYYFPGFISDRLTSAMLEGPVAPFRLVEQVAGIAIDHAVQMTEPAIVDPIAANAIGLAPGTAILRSLRVYFDLRGRVVELLDATYHPAHYRLQATLYPSATRPSAPPS